MQGEDTANVAEELRRSHTEADGKMGGERQTKWGINERRYKATDAADAESAIKRNKRNITETRSLERFKRAKEKSKRITAVDLTTSTRYPLKIKGKEQSICLQTTKETSFICSCQTPFGEAIWRFPDLGCPCRCPQRSAWRPPGSSEINARGHCFSFRDPRGPKERRRRRRR